MAVFISYSHHDSDFVQKLATNLMVRKARVWVDKWELKVGDSLVDRIQEAVQSASALLVVLSQSSVESEWCKKELSAGLLRELEERRVVVLPVRLDDCQAPIFLRGKLYADFRTSFDDGLASVLEGIAGVTTEALGTTHATEHPHDWGIYADYFNDFFEVHVMGAEQDKERTHTIVTEVVIRANEAGTKVQRRYQGIGLDWYSLKILLGAFGKFAGQNTLQFVLSDEQHQVLSFEFFPPGGAFRYQVQIRARRLGGHNGKDIFVDVGSQLSDMCATYCDRLRELTTEEKAKMRGSLAGP